jgi:peptidoglycan/LPS O-acetylase OafA/YrhL
MTAPLKGGEMRSTEGAYFSRLDHVRALAAYLVFVWHFIHLTEDYPVPFDAVPPFPMSWFEEGHTGVSLFMALSGYLFAKLTAERSINYTNFLFSRAMRLGPLLLVCLLAWSAIGFATGQPLSITRLIEGLLLPRWPQGMWSLTVELHFYAAFPFLIWAGRRYGLRVFGAALIFALTFRAGWWLLNGEVQRVAYWTIIGHIDQFLLGMLFALLPLSSRARAVTALVSFVLLLVFWQAFNMLGGFFALGGGYPSTSPLWIVIPTIEALAYASMIAWYDNSKVILPTTIDRILSKIGEWSYSIYLLHFFFRHVLIVFAGKRIGSDSNFWIALVFATICFAAFLPVAAMSYEFFERRFLRFRRPYLFGSENHHPRTSS